MFGDSLGYIASLDVGTTVLRCEIIDSQAKSIGIAYSNVRNMAFRADVVVILSLQVKLHYPKPGYVEIDPDELWEDILDVIHRAISGKSLFN